MQTHTLVEDGPHDGYANMAADAALLAREGVAARVYGWEGVWVSLGRSQKIEEALVDPPATRWVMRPTGGSVVLHGHDVTVGLAVPRELLLCVTAQPMRVVERLYRAITVPIIEALNLCGVPAALAADTAFVRGRSRVFDCFASVAPNDIVDATSGFKVCGCALRSTREKVLLQASIPNGPPLVEPSSVIRSALSSSSPAWEASPFPLVLAQSVERAYGIRVELQR